MHESDDTRVELAHDTAEPVIFLVFLSLPPLQPAPVHPQCTKVMARASSLHTTPLHLSSFSSCSHYRPSSPPPSAAQYPKVMAREARASNAHTPLRLSFFKSLEDLYPNPPSERGLLLG